jgi:hypothetical protein
LWLLRADLSRGCFGDDDRRLRRRDDDRGR